MRKRFRNDPLDLSRLDAGTRRAISFVSRFGLAARGVVFLVIGFFLLRAALGLLAYGVYELLRARYRRIRTGVAPPASDTQIRLERS